MQGDVQRTCILTVFIDSLATIHMGHGFFKPTKYKLVLFVVIMFVLFFVPMVPVTKTPVLGPNSNPQSLWTADSILSMDAAIGTSTKSFGVFSGATSTIMGSLYLLVIGYVLSCIILYGYHKMHR